MHAALRRRRLEVQVLAGTPFLSTHSPVADFSKGTRIVSGTMRVRIPPGDPLIHHLHPLMNPPALRLITERLVLRCWHPDDAPLLQEAVCSSLEHLRPWMPWAHDEPATLETRRARLEKFAADFREGRDAVYGIFNASESMVLGGTGIHHRNGDHDREIGYWLRAGYTGQGIITESTAALTSEAFAAWPISQVTIVCDPLNVRSAAVPKRLGFEFTGLFPTTQSIPGRGEDMIWRVTREAWLLR